MHSSSRLPWSRATRVGRTFGLLGVIAFPVCCWQHRQGSDAPGPVVALPRADARDSGRDGPSDGRLVGDGESGEHQRAQARPPAALCALRPSAVGHPLPTAKPFTRVDPSCADAFCDAVEKPVDPAETCFVAQSNLARAEREARSAVPSRSTPARWDRVAQPRYLDRIDAHLHLTQAEHTLLRKHGFVVLDRLAYPSFAEAFHDIFQEELPVYVSPDPILHALGVATENRLEAIETKELKKLLGTLVGRLQNGLRNGERRYSVETRKDLDIYLGVASRLLQVDADATASLFGNEDAIDELVSHVRSSKRSGDGLVALSLFGRLRVIDFSQFTPRGHYAYHSSEPLDSYFQAMMWLSRLEFNLVSRSCKSSHPGTTPDPQETPREARDALALADLVSQAGAVGALQRFETVYATFGGPREDVSIPTLLRLATAAHTTHADPKAPEKLRAVIGDKFRRTARTHFMPEQVAELPVISTLFGPRLAPDAASLTELVTDKVYGRTNITGADVGYALGHDRAKAYLSRPLASFPSYAHQLEVARAGARRTTNGREDLYGSWFRTLLALAPAPEGAVPSFLRTEAYADARMNSALVGFAHLRHAYVLVAGQGYDAYGCEIPDGYVEPLLPLYEAALAHVRRLRDVGADVKRFEVVLGMLRSIAQTELSGAALSEPQRRWLGMVAENIPSGGYSDSGAPPKWTGWYFDMFEDREFGASRGAAFIADYFTLTNLGQVAYLGSEGPRLGVFVVDAGGEPRAMVGPVAKGFEGKALIASRLTDDDVFTQAQRTDGWRASYAVPPLPTPPLGLTAEIARCDGGRRWSLALSAPKRVGPITVTLLDHHGDPITAPVALDLVHGETILGFDFSQPFACAHCGPEGVHLRIADLGIAGAGTGPYDYATSPGVYQYPSERSEYPGLRPSGLHSFGIGAPRPDAVAPRTPPLNGPI